MKDFLVRTVVSKIYMYGGSTASTLISSHGQRFILVVDGADMLLRLEREIQELLRVDGAKSQGRPSMSCRT